MHVLYWQCKSVSMITALQVLFNTISTNMLSSAPISTIICTAKALLIRHAISKASAYTHIAPQVLALSATIMASRHALRLRHMTAKSPYFGEYYRHITGTRLPATINVIQYYFVYTGPDCRPGIRCYRHFYFDGTAYRFLRRAHLLPAIYFIYRADFVLSF